MTRTTDDGATEAGLWATLWATLWANFVALKALGFALLSVTAKKIRCAGLRGRRSKQPAYSPTRNSCVTRALSGAGIRSWKCPHQSQSR